MAQSLNPTEGIRLLLERQEVAGDQGNASYAAAVYTVDDCYRYRALLQLDGTATLSAEGESASSDDEESLSKLAKSTARAAKRKLADKLAPWPPRVLRWRGPGRG